MNIIKYRPTINSLLDWDIDGFFDNVFAEDSWLLEGHHHPAVDVKEEDDQYVLIADLPGLTDKDLDVKVDGNLLTIATVKHETKEQNEKGYILKERKVNAFRRSFVLPRDADRDKIEAAFKDGVLTLKLAKSPESKPKQIEIKS